MHTVQEAVLAIVRSYAEDAQFGSDLEELGIDSLGLLEIGCELEGLYGDKAYLGGNDLGRIKTVQDLIDFINR